MVRIAMTDRTRPRMSRTRLLACAALAVLAGASGCRNGAADAASGVTSAPSVVSAPTVAAAEDPVTCRDDRSYRAVFRETDPETGEVFTDLFQEVAGDSLRTESAGLVGRRGLLILEGADGNGWSYEGDEWTELPTRPVRPLRVPWVNNFVTGARIEAAFVPIGEEMLNDIRTRLYEADLAEFSEAFPDKIQDSEYDAASTTFRYWVDTCAAVVKAEVTTTFLGEDAEFMQNAGLPVVLRYDYSLYDVGELIAFPRPGDGEPDPIPRP